MSESMWTRVTSPSEDYPDEFNRTALVKTAASLAGLAGLLLPWVTIDGYTEAMSAAEMIEYAFHSPERGALFQVSKLGTLVLLLAPIITLMAICYGLVQNMILKNGLGAPLTALTGPVLTLLVAGPVLSTDVWSVAGITMPGFGMALVLVTQGALFLDSLTEGCD